MNFSNLKRLPIADLVNIAQEMGVENIARMRKR
jgi:transcription termination factor Rho